MLFIPAHDMQDSTTRPLQVHDCRCTMQVHHPPIAGDILGTPRCTSVTRPLSYSDSITCQLRVTY
eukprot:scaffold230605_cov19-Tisochrysis_lutea.AAC.1